MAQCFFLRLVAATKLFRRDKDFKKVSSTHDAICRSDIWVQLVARPVHTEWSVANLSHSVFTSSSFSYSAPGARDGPGRRGPWEWGRKHTRVSLIKTKSNCPEKFKITIILQVPIDMSFGFWWPGWKWIVTTSSSVSWQLPRRTESLLKRNHMPPLRGGPLQWYQTGYKTIRIFSVLQTSEGKRAAGVENKTHTSYVR